MTEALLDGVRVLDLTGAPAASAGRILADLGADVIRAVPEDGDLVAVLGGLDRLFAWTAGQTWVRDVEPDLLRAADVVLDTPGFPGTFQLDPDSAPNAIWVHVTPFGMAGPRAQWRASDLGVMAASGNLWCTGDPDRAPVRCAEPVAYAHTGPEAAFAALTALASGAPQRVDLSMQETVGIANMGGIGRYVRDHDRGRRRGANIGRTREIWPCTDGWVSFGIRGGKARLATWQTVTRLMSDEGLDTSALEGRDWVAFNHNNADQEDLDAISSVLAQWFAKHTMTELYQLACEHNLTLAPINSPREILASEQLASRGFFGPVGEIDRFPRPFVQARSADGDVTPVAPTRLGGARSLAEPAWAPRAVRPSTPPPRAWEGTTIIEFGSGAAGPIATRYFAEHGATVIRVESKSRPDFLRVYALGPKNPHGLDGAPMFDSLNAGKKGITLNLKHPEGRELAIRLIGTADAVAENFAPKAMTGLGLDYDSLVEHTPDLVMISACLNGQTGPHRDYPGFGGQGAALAGFNHLTGWPDREPVGPFGTITDSLAPRFVAAALAAGLLYRRRTGKGVYLDLSQVEAGSWALSPWLIHYVRDGVVTDRMGNRSEHAAPHGVFPCDGDDRWVAIAVWNDDEWSRLAAIVGFDDPSLDGLPARLARVDEVEEVVASWTRRRRALDIAEQLQSAGLEAVPVQDFGDCFEDPQLRARDHFEALVHPNLGEGRYERNGFRLSSCSSGYGAASPLLGQHNEEILCGRLGLSRQDLERLAEEGALD